MKRKALPLLAAILLLAVPGISRADLTFQISQDLSGLFAMGPGNPPNPFFFIWGINSGDLGGNNNGAMIFNVVYNGITLADPTGGVQNPLANPSVTGSTLTTTAPNPYPIVFAGEDDANSSFSPAFQEFAVTSATASISFWVTVSQNYVPGAAIDNFQYSIAYAPNPGDGILDAIAIETDLGPGGDAFAYVGLTPDATYQSVQTGGPAGNVFFPGLNAIGAAVVNPEPGTMVIWGLTLGGLGYYQRRRKLALVSEPAIA